MYHISNDKRAIKSAQLICEATMLCLEEKPLKNITVTDIYNKCYISRATFYRLFDNVNDVILYQCDRIFMNIADKAVNMSLGTSKDFYIFFIQSWIENAGFLRVLSENDMLNILYITHMKYSTIIQNFFVPDYELSIEETDYLISVLNSMLPAVLNIWQRHGSKETANELFSHIKKTILLLNNVM